MLGGSELVWVVLSTDRGVLLRRGRQEELEGDPSKLSRQGGIHWKGWPRARRHTESCGFLGGGSQCSCGCAVLG